jgi:hypothetical protein
MSEKYEPTQEEYQHAQESLSPEERKMSAERALIFNNIEDEVALKDSELVIDRSVEDEITVVGRVRDYDVILTQKGKFGTDMTHVVKIGNYPPVDDEGIAEDLFNKYYKIAKAQEVKN